MNNFEELNLIENYGYEVDPLVAEELGAFHETALNKEDIDDFIENKGLSNEK
ncbi:TPA: hypothetical protein ACGTNJ_001706 [Campylobacter jejuni]|uniref:hypothetical protein n=1 Tax=Campylobacter sp. CNRCH_2016_3089 TaxID=2911609 RepID=UPI0021E649B6|nr:hypothetical protein [Campylobacter sp. CNRCH_2016_3089]MCV3433338.1 hypothetical protein [Campylobacter lari]MCV3509211.1 hypothetical protein [Campylobacter sp. CNRCH_2016_3089]